MGHPLRDVSSVRDARGFTLIEVMIAVSLAAISMVFVFNIQFRMQESYSVQTKVSDLQYTLQSVQAMIDREAKQAGYLFPNGFRTDLNGDLDGDASNQAGFPIGFKTTGELNSAVQIVDGGGNAPDVVRFFTADPNQTQRIGSAQCPTSGPSVFQTVNDAGTGASAVMFSPGDLVVIVNAEFDPDDEPGTLPLAVSEACVGRVVLSGTATFQFAADSTPACAFVCANHADAGANAVTRAYRFSASGYRVIGMNIGTEVEGVLQRSATGGMLNDWQDIALGFIDFQVQATFVRTNNYFATGSTPTLPAYRPAGYATLVTPYVDQNIVLSGSGVSECDVNQVSCTNINWRSGGAVKDLLSINPAPAGGNDIQLTDVSFTLFAQSLNKVGGITAVSLAEAGNRGIKSTAYLQGAWSPTKERAIRFLSWRADLRNLGIGY